MSVRHAVPLASAAGAAGGWRGGMGCLCYHVQSLTAWWEPSPLHLFPLLQEQPVGWGMGCLCYLLVALTAPRESRPPGCLTGSKQPAVLQARPVLGMTGTSTMCMCFCVWVACWAPAGRCVCCVCLGGGEGGPCVCERRPAASCMQWRLSSRPPGGMTTYLQCSEQFELKLP